MKHKFENIGEVNAAIIMAALAANPELAFLTAGISGKIVFQVAKFLCMSMASMGLIVLNVGAAKIETFMDQGNYDGTWDSAEKIISKIRDSGRDLTDEEIRNIDGPVISAFRKFARLGKRKS